MNPDRRHSIAPDYETSSPIGLLASRLKGVKELGVDRWMALCPSHSDRQQSLAIAIGRSGCVLVHCHAGCKPAAIVQSVGLTLADLFPKPIAHADRGMPASIPTASEDQRAPSVDRRPRLVTVYDYRTADGTLAFQSCRFDPKAFRQRRPAANGEWIYNLKGVTPILYRLPQVLEAVEHGRRVFVVEGEKDADALATLGYPATTNPMGAGRWRDEYACVLNDADVVVLPDNDEPGRAHANDVARSLHARHAIVKVVALPGIPEKGDVSDWLTQGHTAADLERLIELAPRWTPEPSHDASETPNDVLLRTNSAEVAESTARPLREWKEKAELLRPPSVVYPRLLHEARVTLLSGREKVGKTTAVAGVAAAASLGSDVLGTPIPAPVTTLWYAIDEPVSDTIRRFDQLGADVDRIIINDAPRTVAELLVAITRDLLAFPDVRGIVVDTLSRVFAGSGIDPNSSREVEPVLAQLVDLIHHRNAGCLLLYHTGKAGREYRGSTAIGATVDDIVTLRRRAHGDEDDFDDDVDDDGRRLLVQEGRNLRGRVHLICVDGHYRIWDDAMPTRQKILEALGAHGWVASRSELVRLASVKKQTGLSAISDLIAEGAIAEKGTGKLCLPGSHGSRRFPQRRTNAEPTAGTNNGVPTSRGSAFGDPDLAEIGTALAEPGSAQELRLLARLEDERRGGENTTVKT